MGMLDGRVAIVTGGGRGVGAEVAKMFAANGAKVLVNDPGVGGGGEGVGIPAVQGDGDPLPGQGLRAGAAQASGRCADDGPSIRNSEIHIPPVIFLRP